MNNALGIPSVTCDLTLNGATGNIQASVGTQATWAVKGTLPSGAKAHWRGTKNGVSDLDGVYNDASVFNGPFPAAGVGVYTRYVQFEDEKGQVLCDSRLTNKGAPLSVEVVAAASGSAASCSLNLNGLAGYVHTVENTQSSWTVPISGVTGLYTLYWYGTKDGAVDMNGEVHNDPTVFNGPFLQNAGGHKFTRYVLVKNNAGSVLCDTRQANKGQALTVDIDLAASAMRCSLLANNVPGAQTLKVGDNLRFDLAITNIDPSANTLRWEGTKDGATDLSAVQNNIHYYDGPLLADAAGHTFARYLTVRDSAGKILCDTRDGYGLTSITVQSASAGVSCQLAVNGQKSQLSAKVGDMATWSASVSGAAAGSYSLKWYGTRDNVVDMNGMVYNDASVFNGPWQSDSAGHSFSRYFLAVNSSNQTICDSRTANSGSPLKVDIAAAATPPPSQVSCLVAVNNVYGYYEGQVGDQTSWQVQVTGATGYQLRWYGTDNGATDLNGVIYNDPTVFNGPWQPGTANHTYTRYVLVQNAQNQTLCDTRTIYGGQPLTVVVKPSAPPAPGCALKVNGQSQYLDAQVGMNASWTVSVQNISGQYDLHWYGTADGVTDLNGDVYNDPTIFNGAFQSGAANHTYVRYVQVKNSAGTLLCDSRNENGGFALSVHVRP